MYCDNHSSRPNSIFKSLPLRINISVTSKCHCFRRKINLVFVNPQDVQLNSPAAQAGLQSQSDYIIGADSVLNEVGTKQWSFVVTMRVTAHWHSCSVLTVLSEGVHVHTIRISIKFPPTLKTVVNSHCKTSWVAHHQLNIKAVFTTWSPNKKVNLYGLY